MPNLAALVVERLTFFLREQLFFKHLLEEVPGSNPGEGPFFVSYEEEQVWSSQYPFAAAASSMLLIAVFGCIAVHAGSLHPQRCMNT